jgi:hypothetical protein
VTGTMPAVLYLIGQPSLMYSNVNYFVGGGVNRAIVVNTNPTAETVLGLGRIVNKMYGFI